MWPLQPIEEEISESESERIENQGTDSDSDSDSDDLHCPSVSRLVMKSVQTLAGDQTPTAVPRLRYECSEVLALRNWDECGSRSDMTPNFRPTQIPFSERYRATLDPFNSRTLAIITASNVLFDTSVLLESYSNIVDSVHYKPSTNDTHSHLRIRRILRYVKNMPQPNLLAKQVANRVIKYARYAKNPHEDDMCCLNCGLFPVVPVTGICGHTRCSKCIEDKGTCPCGKHSNEPLYVNILIRELVDKTLAAYADPRIKQVLSAAPKNIPRQNTLSVGSQLTGSSVGPIKIRRRNRPYIGDSSPEQYRQNIPMSARARYSYALDLLNTGRYKDAVPHLALVAASLKSENKVARPLLAQVIMALSGERDPRALTRELNLLVRHLSVLKCINKNDLECTLCSDIFSKPVTTPCGHMFCRVCLEKTLDYTRRCPLCSKELSMLKLSEVKDTVFIRGALASINALVVPESMDDDDMVPIFVCTVAYPSVPCPLFIFDPQYWIMIRRVLESGSRSFGMIAMEKDKYADYGTILEVRDCVQLEDGKSILSTIGRTRFKVIEKFVRDGCVVARVERIRDIPPKDILSRYELEHYATEVLQKAIIWLNKLSSEMLSDMENAFGVFPATQRIMYEPWWETNNGPEWLWWLVAVLPLRTQIKILILSADRLLKRLMAVYRTLDAVDRIRLTTVSPDNSKVRLTVDE